jgi:hypothetical protein
MPNLVADSTMARRDDVPVKMDAEVVRKAKIVAAFRSESLAEFLSKELGTIVDRLMKEEYDKEVSGKHAKKKPKEGKT